MIVSKSAEEVSFDEYIVDHGQDNVLHVKHHLYEKFVALGYIETYDKSLEVNLEIVSNCHHHSLQNN